ncbi:MAG: hypothetical protein AAB294_03480 [Pseudomonadota bacterium]
MSRTLLGLAIALALITPAYAQSPELAELRDEIKRMKQDYENRIRVLEERLQSVESSKVAAQPAPTETATARAGGKVTSNAFNPAISLILDGKLAGLSKDPTTYALPGFALGAETGPGDKGFRLGESELVMSANVDDKFRGQFTAALTAENTTEVEEAYVETLSLGSGFTARGGRFLSGVGYLNSVHAHAWDFADQPLVYRAMLGNQYKDDGVQLRWVAPTDLFMELGAEVLRGGNFPAGGAARNGKGTNTAFMRIGGDVGTDHSWRAGISRLKAESASRATTNGSATDLYTGTSDLTGVDFVWKWAPDGNPRERNFKFQTEYFARDEDGTFDPASAGTPLSYRGKQKGWYAQGIYQFRPRWRAGLRFDKLRSDAVDAALAGTVLDNQGHNPKRASLMLDYSNSEFSRLRFQVNRDESRLNEKDTQLYLQYIMSLGAHGAHGF